MASSQIDRLRDSFTEMTTDRKKVFIDKLREQLQVSNNKEYIKLLNECVQEYNTEVEKEKKKRRLLVALMLVLSIVIIILVYIIFKYIPKDNSIKDALATGQSTELPAGSIISKNDVELDSRDITILHRSNESTTVLEIWDFAYEDGDTIQVFVDNEPLTEEILLMNEPVEVEVPAIGIVEVRGIFDGGGGITYAVYCGLDETTYFNSAPVGGSNRYIFERR